MSAPVLPMATRCPYTTLFRSHRRGFLARLEDHDVARDQRGDDVPVGQVRGEIVWPERSEEHTSELQSRRELVCRLLLEKKKTGRGYDSAYALPECQQLVHSTS